MLRSPTLAEVLTQEPWNCNTRAVGSVKEFALIPIDAVHISWADHIIFVDLNVHQDVMTKFDLSKKDITVLNIPDVFPFRDKKLIAAIKEELKNAGW